MFNLEDKFVNVGSVRKVETPFIRINEYFIYLMYVNKNTVSVIGAHCDNSGDVTETVVYVCLVQFN